MGNTTERVLLRFVLFLFKKEKGSEWNEGKWDF